MKIDVTLPDRTETFSVETDLVGLRLQVGSSQYKISIIDLNDSLEELLEDSDFSCTYSVREFQISEDVHLTLYCYSTPLFRDMARFPGMVFAEVHTDFARVVITV